MFQVSQGTSKAGSVSPLLTRSSSSPPPSAAGQALAGTYNRGCEAREALAMQWQGPVSRIYANLAVRTDPLPAPSPPPSSAGSGADLEDSRTTALPPTPPSAMKIRFVNS